MNELYPFKFKPFPREMIWGGNALYEHYNKPFPANSKIGESWEVSALPGHISVIENGRLQGNNIEELIEIYMGDLVGEKVFNRFGLDFPLLVKLIDANDVLSVQVHPDDELAAVRHGSYGKTEMWYVLDARPGAELINGFNQVVSPGIFSEKIKEGKLLDILNVEKVSPGDVFFIPAGRVHAIGKGIILAEIQQASDITYRIYDWDRLDTEGNARQLHIDQAMDAIDFNYYKDQKVTYEIKRNHPVRLAGCQYFTTNLLDFDIRVGRDYSLIDSFVIYICTHGQFSVEWEQGKIDVQKGETILIPSTFENISLSPIETSTLLEVYIESD